MKITFFQPSFLIFATLKVRITLSVKSWKLAKLREKKIHTKIINSHWNIKKETDHFWIHLCETPLYFHNLPSRQKTSEQRSQLAHDVETTLYGRWNDIKTLKRRRNNIIVLTSCAGWVVTTSFQRPYNIARTSCAGRVYIPLTKFLFTRDLPLIACLLVDT